MRRSRQQRSRGNRAIQNSTVSSPVREEATILLSQGVDLNTNLGEGFGQYRIEGESEVLPFVTSANIACGAHAGDPLLMEAALEEVRYYGLSLGAHIGYPDIIGFGRREIHLPAAELRASILYQLGALAGLARTLGLEITQVRPHGFLYRQLSHDARVATVVAKAISDFDRWVVLVGPAGPNLLLAGERGGIRVAGEAWIDRVYDTTGSLLPHTHSRAIHKSPQEILNQAARLIRDGEAVTVDGSRIKVNFQTLHLHPHMVNAREVAEAVRTMIPHAAPLTAEPFTLDRTDPSELAFNQS